MSCRTLLAVVAAVAMQAAAPSSPGARPEGQTIAFERVDWRTMRSAIALVEPGGAPRVLRGTAGGSAPAWDPTGTRLAFGRLDRGGWQLLAVRVNGTGLRTLTPTPDPLASDPSWAPDGRSIAFARLPRRVPGLSSYGQQVFVLTLADGRVRRLTSFARFRGGAGGPAWSPDGRHILFWGREATREGARTDVWVVNADGTTPRRLVVSATSPAWAPDGRHIAFVRGGDIYVASADGRGARRLTATPRDEDDDPAFSPDGTRIAFATIHRAPDEKNDTGRVAIVDLDGRGRVEITPSDPRLWAGAPAWRPEAAS